MTPAKQRGSLRIVKGAGSGQHSAPSAGSGRPDRDQTGAVLLNRLRDAITRYVIMPNAEMCNAVTCYIAATYGVTAWEHGTRLIISSPEKRCGKSRLLDIIEATSYNPLITVNISPAALVRSVGDDPPTLLIDEADTIFGKKAAENNEDLRGILNAGHQRNRPYIRWDAASRSLEKCATFSMAVLAGIGDMPDTIADRAVIVSMRRRAPHEKVAPYRRRRDEPALRELGDELGGWVRSQLPKLTAAVPEMPVEDRAADTWEPLVAIADAAGGEWPELIRMACKVLVADADADSAEATFPRRLLADLKVVFGDAQKLYTSTILDRLHKMEDAPWSNYFGRQLTSNDLSKLLRDYRVRPKEVREPGGSNLKGYDRDDLHDAWTRYLTRDTRDTGDFAGQPRRGDETDTATAATPRQAATPLSSQVASVAGVAGGCRKCGAQLDPAATAGGFDTCIGCDGTAS